MKFEIRRLAQDVFSVLKKNWFKLLSASILRTLLATLANMLVFALLINFPFWNLVAASLTYLLVWSALESGFLRMCLCATRSQTVRFGQLFSGLNQTPVFFILTLSYILATAVGIIAFVIPGMFVSIRFSIAGLILIDKSVSLTESVKSSYQLTLGYSRLIAPLLLIGATLMFSSLQIQFIIELVVTIALVVLYLQINEKKQSGAKMKTLLSITGMLTLNFIATFIFSILWSVPCEVRQIKSLSMLPTLKPNDLVFVEKFSPYFNHSFKRGEIVLFYPDFLNAKEKNTWQKVQLAIARIKGETGELAHFRRIAGLPGDVVEIYCPSSKIILPPNIQNQISSNPTDLLKGGSLVKISYRGQEALSQEQKCVGRYAIAKGYLFLIGDNTDYLGILEETKIFGRPQFRFSDFNIIEPQGTNKFFISKEERSQ